MARRPTSQSQITLYYKAKRWIQGMWPFVSATLTGRRGKQRRRIRRETRIRDTTGIDEFYPLELNGTRQWLRIRGRNVENPILLYLHGGPGGSSVLLYPGLLEWERHFTVVHWDQRGAGKSYSRSLDLASMTLPQLVDDAHDVIQHVLSKLSKDKLCLLGHSWGSFLGIHTLLRSTASIGVYVGTGQVADMSKAERLGYEHALTRARDDANDAAIRELEEIEPYPSESSGDHLKRPIARKWARHYGWVGTTADATTRSRKALMTAPEYSLFDIYRYLQGSLVSMRTLGNRLIDPTLQPAVLRKVFDMPFYLFSGATDTFTPTSVADEYFQAVSAPCKKHLVFEQSGHWPMLDEPDGYLDALLTEVRPHIK